MIGFINAYQCDLDPNGYQSQYGKMFLSFFKENCPELEMREYKFALGEQPKSVNECSGWIISGSSKSAYDQDPWIKQLGQFIQNCNSAHTKLVGICFGHQLIAHYLGGKTEKSAKGWGVGIREFNIIQTQSWMHPSIEKCKLIFSHQDQVTELPPVAIRLATDEFCQNQMYSLEQHIFCMQGHPEFTPQFAQDRLDNRIKLLGEELHNTATKSLLEKTDRRTISKWISQFFSA